MTNWSTTKRRIPIGSLWAPNLPIRTFNIAQKKTVCSEVQTYYLEQGKKFLAFGLLTIDFWDALIYQ